MKINLTTNELAGILIKEIEYQKIDSEGNRYGVFGIGEREALAVAEFIIKRFGDKGIKTTFKNDLEKHKFLRSNL